MPFLRFRTQAVKAAALLAATATLSALGLPLQAQIYTSYVFQGVSDGTQPIGYFGVKFIGVSDAPLPLNSFTPNYHFNNSREQYVHNGITTTFAASAAAASRGNWASGMTTSGVVTNGYYPGAANIGSANPPFAYYVQSAFGSATRVTFFSPSSSIVDAQANMHWNVTGNKGATLGRVDPRLDFAVTTANVTSVADIFNPAIAPNPLSRFGFGSSNYHVPILIGQPLNFLFWSSTFWLVNPEDLPAAPQNFSGHVDALHTFNLDSIDLLDANGDPIQQWSLVDTATGTLLWDQNGRVSTVPEPGTSALLAGLCVTGVGFLLRLRRKCRC